MTDERDIQKIYELYKQDKIDLSTVDGSTLLRINRMLDEELEENIRLVCELEELLYGETFVEDPKRKPPKLI